MATPDVVTVAGRGSGRFGAAVLARLGALMSLAVDADSADCVVLALWRPDYARVVDEQHRTFAAGAAFLPVVHDGRLVRVGPMSVPGQAPCAACLSSRLEQHAPNDETVAAAARMADDPDFGVSGFPPWLVAGGAGLAAHMVRSWRTTRQAEPVAYSLGADRAEIRGDRVVAVPDCPGCGGSPRPSVAALDAVGAL